MIYTGVTGAVKKGSGVDAKVIKHISGFDLEISDSLQEVPELGNKWMNRVSSIKDWNVSFDGALSFDNETEHANLIDDLYQGNTITVGLYLDEKTYFEGPCLIESVSISHTADGKAEVSLSAQGAGELEKTIVTSAS